MSVSIQKLREQRNDHVAAARNMMDVTPESDWKKEEVKQKYQDLLNAVAEKDDEIKRHQDLLDLSAEQEFSASGGVIIDDVDKYKAKRRAIDNKWLRGGDNSLTAEDWAIVRNTMSTTTDSEGGYTVQEDVAMELIQALKQFGGMRQVARTIVTGKGNPLSFPTTDGTAETGELVAENGEANDLDPSFGTVAVNTYKFGSKVITVPIELLQDSQINVELFVRERLQERIGRITNTYFTTGSGTAEPGGLMTRASNSNVTVNLTAGITYNKLLDIQHSVDPAYREQGGTWMFNDATLKLIRQLEDDNGRPLFIPSYDRGIAQGAPAELLGDPVQINQAVPAFAGTNRFIAYGLMSKYLIREVMQLELFRFTDSAYTKKGQVGFLAWYRAGGNLLDTTAVKYASATSAT